MTPLSHRYGIVDIPEKNFREFQDYEPPLCDGFGGGGSRSSTDTRNTTTTNTTTNETIGDIILGTRDSELKDIINVVVDGFNSFFAESNASKETITDEIIDLVKSPTDDSFSVVRSQGSGYTPVRGGSGVVVSGANPGTGESSSLSTRDMILIGGGLFLLFNLKNVLKAIK